MSDPSVPPASQASKPVPGNDRADRLAEALRANLKRRKAADRARRDRNPAPSEPGMDEDT